MRVMEIAGAWGLEHLGPATRPDPVPGPGQVVVRIEAASVNYRDRVVAGRGYGRRTGELPLVPVSDGAGTVVATGPGVTTTARHAVAALPDGGTRLRLAVEQGGLLGLVMGRFYRRMTDRYLANEAAGLKARCEGLR